MDRAAVGVFLVLKEGGACTHQAVGHFLNDDLTVRFHHSPSFSKMLCPPAAAMMQGN